MKYPLGCRNWATVALLVTFFGTVVVAEASLSEYQYVEMSVTFAPGAITQEPSIIAGSLCITGDTGQHSIDALSALGSYPVSFVHQIQDRLSSYYSICGPWTIGVVTSTDPDALVAAVATDPWVDSAVLPDVAMSGESANAWFPGPVRDLFCPSQAQLHRAVVGEPVLAEDPCQAPSTEHDYDMDLPQAWAISRGDTSVVVAVIDSGFDLYHPQLGGAGPSQTVEDSLLYYNQGVWFRNWKEGPGEVVGLGGLPDNRPGLAGVNDDPQNDDYEDEDCWGNLPEDSPDPGILTGKWTSLGLYTIEDSTASWEPDSLRNKVITLTLPPVFATRSFAERIVANTATTITTNGVNFLDLLIHTFGQPGWATYADPSKYPNMISYKIGNGTDVDGDTLIDDLGYIGCPDDDDENGFEDDFRGWDFFDMPRWLSDAWVGCSKEDYSYRDNDPRSFFDHGTAIASQIASADDSGRMMGIAPNVKILPIRCGAQYNCGTDNEDKGSLELDAVRYDLPPLTVPDPGLVFPPHGV